MSKESDGDNQRFLISLNSRLEHLEQLALRIHACLWGNGNPTSSITDRLSVLERQSKWIMRMGGAIILLLVLLSGLKEIAKLFI